MLHIYDNDTHQSSELLESGAENRVIYGWFCGIKMKIKQTKKLKQKDEKTNNTLESNKQKWNTCPSVKNFNFF